MILPYLSVGVRSKDGKCYTGDWLKVSNILPGQTCEVRVKPPAIGLFKSTDFELYEKPDPGPEDRNRYWEFKSKRCGPQ
jgi:hypothetical protein